MTEFVTPTPALTTIFQPPATCTDIVTFNSLNFWQGELFELGDPNCYPASFRFARNKFFSPGVCPDGWYSASSVSGTGALVTIPTESNALCCPSGYQAIEPSNGPVEGNTIFCGSVINTILTNVYLTPALDDGPLPEDYTASTTTVDPATLDIRPTVWAEVIQVRWQPTDAAVVSLQSKQANKAISPSSVAPETSSTPIPSSSSPTFIAATTSAKMSSTTSVQAAPQKASGDELSVNMKAGIAVGSVAIFVFILFGIVFFMMKYKARSVQPPAASPTPRQHDKFADFGSLKYRASPKELQQIFAQRPRAELVA